MRARSPVRAAALVVAGVASFAGAARAQPEELQVVALETRSGDALLFVVDSRNLRIAVYRHQPERPLTLEAVRHIEYDLRFAQFPRRQNPSVAEVRDATADARPRAAATIAGLVDTQLELAALHESAEKAAPSGAEPPTWRGIPLRKRQEQLEREVVRARLTLLDSSGGPAALRAALLEELTTREADVAVRIRHREEVRAALPDDHGGAHVIEGQLEELRTLRARLAALRAREQGPDSPAAGDDGASGR